MDMHSKLDSMQESGVFYVEFKLICSVSAFHTKITTVQFVLHPRVQLDPHIVNQSQKNQNKSNYPEQSIKSFLKTNVNIDRKTVHTHWDF